MAGFTSFDDFINQSTTNGKQWRTDWQKSFPPTTAAVAGEWHSMARGAGNPAADALFDTTTNLAMCTSYEPRLMALHSGGLYHGGFVGAAGDGYKVITAAGAWTAAATVAPCIMQLVDVLGFVYVTSTTTTTAQTVVDSSTFTADAGTDVITHASIDFLNYTKVRLTTTTTLPAGLSLGTDYWTVRQSSTTSKLATSLANAIANTTVDITDTGTGTHTAQFFWPRYSDGAGVQCMIYNPHATALGAATPNMSLGYTNSAGTASRATPTVLPIGKTAAANGIILYTGTGSGKYGHAMPLQGSDAGVRSVETVQNATSYVSGQYAVCVYKPILQIPVTTLGVPGERNLMTDFPSLPKVYDGANLVWFINSGANTPVASVVSGALEFAWS